MMEKLKTFCEYFTMQLNIVCQRKASILLIGYDKMISVKGVLSPEEICQIMKELDEYTFHSRESLESFFCGEFEFFEKTASGIASMLRLVKDNDIKEGDTEPFLKMLNDLLSSFTKKYPLMEAKDRFVHKVI